MASWIGLTGRMGAGKDYVFGKLKELDGYLVRVSLADQLRFEVEKYLGEGDLPVLWEKPYSEPVRRMLQWWGTEFRRAEDPDYWVKKAEAQAREVADRGGIPVFTDVRFPNEADMVRNNGGFIVRVHAPASVREERLGMLPPEHASETSMDTYETDLNILSTRDNPMFEDNLAVVIARSREYDMLQAIQERRFR